MANLHEYDLGRKSKGYYKLIESIKEYNSISKLTNTRSSQCFWIPIRKGNTKNILCLRQIGIALKYAKTQ
jgi:hypothetical protein